MSIYYLLTVSDPCLFIYLYIYIYLFISLFYALFLVVASLAVLHVRLIKASL